MTKPAILGGDPTRARDYPTWPVWDEADRQRLNTVLETGAWWDGDGDLARTFATRFAALQGARHGLPMTNGTHTLEAALWACGVGEGDEVIVPGLTFVASATAAIAVGATPILVDVDPETLNIDPAAAEAAITDRTRAIIAVHVAGAAADLDALVELCQRRGVHLIEDCAHAHGTTWRGKGVGSWGSFGSFSMQHSKLMTAGEGGALITSDDALHERAWEYWNCGREPGKWFYHHAVPGSNLRMTEWQGAILLGQLERFPEQNRIRNANALELCEALLEIPGLRPQRRDPRMELQGNYCFVFHYDRSAFAGMPLRTFEAALAAEGIPMGVSYPALNTLQVFRDGAFAPRIRRPTRPIDWATLSLPVAERLADSTVWLEHRLLLASRDDVLDVARAAQRIHRHAREIVANGPTP
jgi:dTDP-4-amino-4,6-dideoxygalactose transaminase